MPRHRWAFITTILHYVMHRTNPAGTYARLRKIGGRAAMRATTAFVAHTAKAAMEKLMAGPANPHPNVITPESIAEVFLDARFLHEYGRPLVAATGGTMLVCWMIVIRLIMTHRGTPTPTPTRCVCQTKTPPVEPENT